MRCQHIFENGIGTELYLFFAGTKLARIGGTKLVQIAEIRERPIWYEFCTGSTLVRYHVNLASEFYKFANHLLSTYFSWRAMFESWRDATATCYAETECECSSVFVSANILSKRAPYEILLSPLTIKRIYGLNHLQKNEIRLPNCTQ